MEQLLIRPRLRLGLGRQTTFLSGDRGAIEQSYRRSQGISSKDEQDAALEILEPSFFSAREHPSLTKMCFIFRFGASLREWMYRQKDGKGIWYSQEWLRVRKKL